MTWLSALLLLLASIAHPDRARCAPHWWLGEGVRPSGRFACVYVAPEQGWPDHSEDGPAIESRVYCTSGTQPVVVRGVEVGCQRGGYR